MAQLEITSDEYAKLYLQALRNEARNKLEEVLMEALRGHVVEIVDKAMERMEIAIKTDIDYSMMTRFIDVVVRSKNHLKGEDF